MHDWWLETEGDDSVRSRVAGVRGNVAGALELARSLADTLPQPGGAKTLQLWDTLARSASVDLTVTRAMEPHLDAISILRQAGIEPPADATFGVYAAEAPGSRVRARRVGGGWVLDGTKAWCSLAGQVTHALVTSWVDETERGLFLIELSAPRVRVMQSAWVPSGLRLISSGPIALERVPALPVGEPGWYLRRPGFAWGGLGVAAIWYGAGIGIMQRMLRSASGAREPDDLALMHLGAGDSELFAARSALIAAAHQIATGSVPDGAQWAFAVRVRDVCARAAESVLRHADHALGPGPLTSDEHYARLVDDLRIYLRQHHAERDQVVLGRAVLGR